MSSTHPAAVLAALLTLSSQGCSSDQAFELGDDSGWADDSSPDPIDSDDDTGDEDQPDPAWWSLSATVLIEEALPVQGDTTLTVTLIDESADTANPICVARYDQVELTIQDTPDALVYHWWRIDLGEPTTDCSPHPLTRIPTTLELGIGAVHPDIASLLEPAGYDEIEPYLYGAYLRAESEDIWTWGVAATAAGFGAEQLPVTEPPVPDGTYSFVPIYLLPLQGR
jgi:hypothetical protein